jgi:magnesium chelatase subunit D
LVWNLRNRRLLLLAVEPRLRGMAVGAPAGAGKSSLARGMRDLLCSDDRSVPFVELPLGVDEAGLLGGLDIEATLRVGRQVARAGGRWRAPMAASSMPIRSIYCLMRSSIR